MQRSNRQPIPVDRLNPAVLYVRDLDRSVDFYADVVGLSVADRYERQGGPISQVLGYDDTHIRVALLGLDGEDGHILELIEYLNPDSAERPTQERAVRGASQLAFKVTDIHGTFQRLLDQGAVRLNSPAEVAPGRVVCYIQDPDGNWIELIED